MNLQDKEAESSEIMRKILEELFRQISSPEIIPVLGISMSEKSGEYWFLHPGLFNAGLWWQEVIDYGENVREALIRAFGYYTHEKTYDSLTTEVNLNDEAQKWVIGYIENIAKKCLVAIEDSASRLFSFREKLSWILY